MFSTLLTALTALVPMHLGALHHYEKVLTFVIAFGPFVVLGIVVWAVRRRDIALDEAEEEQERR